MKHVRWGLGLDGGGLTVLVEDERLQSENVNIVNISVFTYI